MIHKKRETIVTWLCDVWWQLVSWRQFRRGVTEAIWRRRVTITWWRTFPSQPKDYFSCLAHESVGRSFRFPPRTLSSCRQNKNNTLHDEILQQPIKEIKLWFTFKPFPAWYAYNGLTLRTLYLSLFFLFYFRDRLKNVDWYWRVGLRQKLTSEFNFGS